MMLRIVMLRWLPSFVLVAWLGRWCGPVDALVSIKLSTTSRSSSSSPHVSCRCSATQNNQNDAQQEAADLLERARRMRQEIAALTGTSVEALEREAALKREQQQQRTDQSTKEEDTPKERNSSRRINVILPVPETPDEQVWQAKAAVERAFAAGLTRQTIRWALVAPPDETLRSAMDESWPGGAQQMYRRAAGPLTRQLLQQLRVVAAVDKEQQQQQQQSDVPTALWKQPQVTSRDVWDFDGSAVITSEHSDRPESQVQALVFPNTDTKYTNDIELMDQALGRERLLLLVNPFWRNLDSWGYNILAPQAQAKAQRVIFDPEQGFVETYCVLQKSVRGEDCVALKAYPYDWQLYAYAEANEWPYTEYALHLGSTPQEPTAAEFAERLAQREEFRLGKTMRQMQRRRNQ